MNEVLCLYEHELADGTNLFLHLFHLHLAPLVVGLVESQLSLGASQFVLRLLQLVLQIGGEVHIIRK